jgi:Fe-Mn family superoxide dismutase
MAIQLPPLPYSLDALAPVISEETLKHHYLKHHQGYVDKVNDLILGTAYENMPLEDIIFESVGKPGKDEKIFNNAAQVWNHTFYWSCMTAEQEKPSETIETAISNSFGSMDGFYSKFLQSGKDLFGSGWVWLIKEDDGKLVVEGQQNAWTPISEGRTPILVCDVWEHAYYLDRQENRAKYLELFDQLINWKFVEENLFKPASFSGRPNQKKLPKEDTSETHH